MGKLDPNTLIGIINGRIGDLVFARTSDGTVIVRPRPQRQARFTLAELANQSQFARASAYVKGAAPYWSTGRQWRFRTPPVGST
jgi:hypothetical protein